jgi:hypothetical protein
MEHHTDGNTDSSCLSMYSRGKENCSPSPGIVHETSHRWKYRRFVFVSVFHRQRELLPFPWHCSFNITPMEIPMVRVRWCISEVKGTVPLPLALFIEHDTDGNTNDSCSLVYYKAKGIVSLHMSVMTIKVHWLSDKFPEGITNKLRIPMHW